MLEPHSRTLLFDILRPPDDHRLDCAIAATYTLDLLALLTAPVAFSLFEVDDPAEILKRDSLSLLESLRRYADRLTVFCQAGQIALPKAQFPQFAYLENTVVQCRRPGPGASFHPKVWVLRFLGPNDTPRYRFACLTRNLTFDRCWDTALTLEGEVGGRVITANNPLSEFIRALPGRAVSAASEAVATRVGLMEAEVRRVRFELPEGFTDYRFHPRAPGGRSLPFGAAGQRMLVVSPFVSEDGLRRVTARRKGSMLVTRRETLDAGTCKAPDVARFFVLASEADPASADTEAAPASRGLHAKCYVQDDGTQARIWTGSANATEAGFGRNVEFLVELVGPKSKFGIDALMKREDGKTNLIDLLQEVSLPEAGKIDETAEGLRATIDRMRDAIAGAGLAILVTDTDDGYDLRLSSAVGLDMEAQTSVTCWPVTVGRHFAQPLQAGVVDVVFASLSLEGLSGFMAFEVRTSAGDREAVEIFVVNLPIEGAPVDRKERLLRSVLTDRKRFLQYLLLLLTDEGVELGDQIGEIEKGDRDQSNGFLVSGAPVLEALMRTLERSPERLDHVARLVDDIRKQDGAHELFPPGFDDIWKPIWAARQEMKSCAS
jgi:hypothetical protein